MPLPQICHTLPDFLRTVATLLRASVLLPVGGALPLPFTCSSVIPGLEIVHVPELSLFTNIVDPVGQTN